LVLHCASDNIDPQENQQLFNEKVVEAVLMKKPHAVTLGQISLISISGVV
jgi:hypothetical protein